MKIINKSILTIGIPVYNGGSDLKRLLDSIFSQNFDRELVEIIISNKGCSFENPIPQLAIVLILKFESFFKINSDGTIYV